VDKVPLCTLYSYSQSQISSLLQANSLLINYFLQVVIDIPHSSPEKLHLRSSCQVIRGGSQQSARHNARTRGTRFRHAPPASKPFIAVSLVSYVGMYKNECGTVRNERYETNGTLTLRLTNSADRNYAIFLSIHGSFAAG